VLIVGGAIAYLVFCEARKAYWDDWVKLLCKEEGGVKVYEKVELNLEEYNSLFPNSPSPDSGIAKIPSKEGAKKNDKYFIDINTKYFRKASPEVWQLNTQIYRASDGKLIAEQVGFARVGGDFPTHAHHSSFGCSDIHLKFQRPFLDAVFFQKQ
jgi:hypothetical protein